MRYRQLGKTGLKVSEMGFGAWGIGRQFWKGGDDEESLETLTEALKNGVNFFDTALGYGRGHSEKLIASAFDKVEQTAFVATKIPPQNFCWPAQGSLEEAFPRDHIRHAVELSRANLGGRPIDLIQLHVWSPSWIADRQWLTELERLKDEGSVRHIGVSANDHDPGSVLELVSSGLIDTIQVIYNIFDQSAEAELFPECIRHDVGVIARVPFDEGALTGLVTRTARFPRKDWRNKYFAGKRREEVEERVTDLQQFLGDEVASLPELALRFCLSNSAVSTVIPGMRKAENLQHNLRAVQKGILPDHYLERIKAHHWPKNFYVY